MREFLDSLATAFNNSHNRLAVFDYELRTKTGQWELPSPIPGKEIIAELKGHGGFTVDKTEVYLPLHKPGSAEITGEYLVYRPDQLVECVVYFDYGRGSGTRIQLDEFNTAYPAWRLRYWHPDIEPRETPTWFDSNRNAAQTASPGSESKQRESSADDGTEAIDAAEFFHHLREFLTKEREATRTQARETFERLAITEYTNERAGVPVLEGRGLAVDQYGQQVARLAVADEAVENEPESDIDIPDRFGIYPGTEVIVGGRTALEGFPVEAEVLDVDGRVLELGMYWDRADSKGAAESTLEKSTAAEFCVGELLNPVPTQREFDAIATIEEDEEKRAVVTGGADLELGSALDARISKSRLNTSQFQAAQTALRAEQIHCIHGPPGTGKTRTLVEMIRAASTEGEKVLATAHSNQAVDNLLLGDSTAEYTDPRSLHGLAKDGEVTIARVGTNSEHEFVLDEYGDTQIWEADVVCATTSGAADLADDRFAIAIVDEAGQATIPASLVPYTKAESLVLAGDHKQLPPYHSSEQSEEEAIEPSLFEHLIAQYPDAVSTLDTQYRMHAKIAAFPNQEFYGGMLSHGAENKGWTIRELPPLEAHHIEGEEKTTPGNSYYNDAEVTAVREEIEALLMEGVSPRNIGVITPYSGQVGYIRKAVAQLNDPELDELQVATVDSFQGSERDVIIISFVRSNPQGFSGFLTFPSEGPRRLNVALTRARRRCVLIGDFDTLRTVAPTREEAESAADVYDRLFAHLQAEGALTTPTQQ